MRDDDHDDLQRNQIVEVGNLERSDDSGYGIFSHLFNCNHRKITGLGLTQVTVTFMMAVTL